MSGSRWDNLPIDELLRQAPVRILRGLKFVDWIDVYDLRDLILDCTYEDAKSKNAISAALLRLIRSGLIERRDSLVRLCGMRTGNGSHCYDVRITDAGRAWLANKLKPDTDVEFAPARPGSEHFLILDADEEAA